MHRIFVLPFGRADGWVPSGWISLFQFVSGLGEIVMAMVRANYVAVVALLDRIPPMVPPPEFMVLAPLSV
jgi:hypothetical protein